MHSVNLPASRVQRSTHILGRPRSDTALPASAPRRTAARARGASRRRTSVIVMTGDKISGKNVVITGAGRGIGLEFAKQFLERGNRVVGTVRRREAAGDLEALGDGISVSVLDVTDQASIDTFAQELASQVEHVDVLINNAGLLIYSDFESVSADDMMACFRVNTLGPLLVSQALVRQKLIGSGGESIIGNVTSKMLVRFCGEFSTGNANLKVGSNADNGSGGGYAYRASKAALNIANTSMSIDLADRGVTSVLLHPGWVRTEMTGRNGLIDADQSAGGLICVLESDLPLQGKWYDYKHEAIPW